MTGCPLVLPKTGTICGKPIPDDFGRCKDHTSKVACPYLLPGDKPCLVAIPEGWQNIDPVGHSKHPHHEHYKVRMVVIDPVHRLCQECHAVSTHLEGYCDLHAPLAQQARREMIIEALDFEATQRGQTIEELTRKDRAEILNVLAAHDAAQLAQSRRFDVTSYVVIDNPYAELYKLAGQTVAWKDALAARVSELQEIGYEGRTGEQTKAEVNMFMQAIQETRQILTAIAKLDVEERMVRIAEAQAIMIAETLSRVLDTLGLSAEKQLQARAAVAERLRIVGGGTNATSRTLAN